MTKQIFGAAGAAVGVSVALLVGGCASTLSVEQQAAVDKANQLVEADRLVNTRIADAVGSIGNTLALIERIERGQAAQKGGAAPKPSLNGGAAAPSRAASVAPSAGPAPAPTAEVSTNGPAKAQGVIASMLDARISIEWKNGSPEELLKQLADSLKIPFRVVGVHKALPKVTVVSKNESIRAVLMQVANQIDKEADIRFVGAQEPAVLELAFK